MEMPSACWDTWVSKALVPLNSRNHILSLRPIHLRKDKPRSQPLVVFDDMQQWDRSSVEVEISETTFNRWVNYTTSSGDDDDDIIHSAVAGNDEPGAFHEKFKKLILFSTNDYLGLSSHPTIGSAAAKAALEHGMGPRGAALSCGYTSYHRLLESSLADLKKKEDCLLCPTGCAANMALMSTIGSMASLLAGKELPSGDEMTAVFSDALNHASIIDGIRVAERQKGVKVYIYKHCDMSHLNELLSQCRMRRKVVVTDSLFSMDGDYAPMVELARLRKKHNFLLVIDEAHGTFVCGKNGGGVAEEFNCEKDVDICIGTLSKAAGCHGGFIACSKSWKLLIQSRGRSFIFSTATPVPVAAAAHAAVGVAKHETWRRKALWNRVKDFHLLTGIPVTSHIISLVVGSEDKAQQASRLRVALSAVHTRQDLENLTAALSRCINFQDVRMYSSNCGYARL
ncbi:8-amino-7-oxononanoate synthase-like isoform X2 [Lotus japonicus]|uniref:8-amino-7-oxononanoate synthase-like isoform X2 n=1 Tax=Lotus japonicus TaxID=34305 RepID=UPI0025908E26|nr:8-amino-7-oxononanoate synthase-like isoform X2 [Lotus japonicus]